MKAAQLRLEEMIPTLDDETATLLKDISKSCEAEAALEASSYVVSNATRLVATNVPLTAASCLIAPLRIVYKEFKLAAVILAMSITASGVFQESEALLLHFEERTKRRGKQAPDFRTDLIRAFDKVAKLTILRLKASCKALSSKDERVVALGLKVVIRKVFDTFLLACRARRLHPELCSLKGCDR